MSSLPIVPADPADLGLAECYSAVRVFTCDEPVSTKVELAKLMADWERALGKRSTVVFTRLRERPGERVLAHPYPPAVLLRALGTTDEDKLTHMARRLTTVDPGWEAGQPPGEWTELGGLDALPVIQHRPGDAGHYITAGIAVSTRTDGTAVNLGVYRVQVVSGRAGRIFLDPRTDGYRNLAAWLALGEAMPVSIFLGANPVFMLVAASRLPVSGDDYQIAAKLLGSRVRTAGSPPVPASATQVITGRVLAETAEEGPFGEFKGYYVDARQSNVFEVDSVVARAGAVYPTIVAGAESGLSLMSLQNEYLMYAHLTELGFAVRSVRYPLAARGEFLTLIETEQPSQALLTEAMRFDKRTKVVICGPDLTQVWQSVATYGFSTMTEPYLRKGVMEGERIGLVLEIPPSGRLVEY